MDIAGIAREVASLPPEAQREILDFLDFLKSRYSSPPAAQKAKRSKLVDEPFVGMWQDRKDMQDSTAWVRSQRRWEQSP
jgi:hypothetical protein